MKYKSELLSELIEKNGHTTTKVPHYESECENEFISEVRGAYPKLCDYSGEWLNYANNHVNIGKFPTERVVNVTNARFENVVPYGYKSAILKGCTGYRDIDTGEFLETFEEGRNLELVSVKMPVLTTTGKNLFDFDSFKRDENRIGTGGPYSSFEIKLKPNTQYSFNRFTNDGYGSTCYFAINTVQGSYLGNLTWLVHSDNQNINYQQGRFTTDNTGIVYISGIFNDNNLNKTFELIQNLIIVESNTIPTTYEPYKTNILTVNEPVELRGIGDVQDTLDCLTGEVVERIGEIVLDGSEKWVISQFTRPNHLRLYFTGSKFKQYQNVINSRFPDIGNIQNRDVEGVYITNTFDIQVEHSRLSEVSLDGFKQWLSQNPITVQYRLATESIKTVDLSCLDENNNPTKFKPYEGVMNVVVSSETLPPLLDMEVPVEAINQNLAGFIK